jgi:hypothetical protein
VPVLQPPPPSGLGLNRFKRLSKSAPACHSNGCVMRDAYAHAHDDSASTPTEHRRVHGVWRVLEGSVSPHEIEAAHTHLVTRHSDAHARGHRTTVGSDSHTARTAAGAHLPSMSMMSSMSFSSLNFRS